MSQVSNYMSYHLQMVPTVCLTPASRVSYNKQVVKSGWQHVGLMNDLVERFS